MFCVRDLILFGWIALVQLSATSDESEQEDFDKRLSIYLLNEAEVMQRVQVAVSSERFNHEGNLVDDAVRHVDLLNSTYYRLSCDRKKNVQRTDGVCESAQEGARTIFICQSVFLEPDSCLYRLDMGTNFKQLAKSRQRKVETAESKPGKIPIRVYTSLISPFVLAYRPDLVGVDTADLAMFSNSRTIDQRENKDGSTEMTVAFSSKKAAFRVKFQKEPDWLPEECTFFMSQDEGLANKWPTLDDLKKWKSVGKIAAKWQEIDSNWVPSEIVMTFENQGENSITTVKFMNWRFGDDVEDDLFDRELFTTEKLSKLDYAGFLQPFEPK